MDEFESRLPSIDKYITEGMSPSGHASTDFELDLIQNDYAGIFASCFRKERSERAKKDKSLRCKTRKLFDILSSLLNRIQVELPIEISKDCDDRPYDTNRCRDSDLRTLRKTNKTLEALIEVSRELKKKKKEVKAMKKAQDRKKERIGGNIHRGNWSLSRSSRKLPLSHESQHMNAIISTQDSQLASTHAVENPMNISSAGSIIYPPHYLTYLNHYNS